MRKLKWWVVLLGVLQGCAVAMETADSSDATKAAAADTFSLPYAALEEKNLRCGGIRAVAWIEFQYATKEKYHLGIRSRSDSLDATLHASEGPSRVLRRHCTRNITKVSCESYSSTGAIEVDLSKARFQAPEGDTDVAKSFKVEEEFEVDCPYPEVRFNIEFFGVASTGYSADEQVKCPMSRCIHPDQPGLPADAETLRDISWTR